MQQKLTELFEKLKKDKKSAIVILVGIAGIFFIALSNFFADESINSNVDTLSDNSQTEAVLTVEQIEEHLEKRLEKTIKQIKGAGETTVMVSVSSSAEYVYAKNDKTETDSDSSSVENEIVICEDGDNNSGLVISINSPDVLGVVVICQGGGSAVIKSEITQLIKSLFGIGSDRVYVGTKN